MNKFYHKSSIIFVLGALFSLLMLGCEEEELYTLSQEEEVERYIIDSDIGKAFFADDQFEDTLWLSFPDDDAVYVQILDSIRREIAPRDLGNLLELQTGSYYYCNAEVADWLYYTLIKNSSGEISSYQYSRLIRRYGFLVKLGSNSQAFSGWLLQGFASDTSNILNIQTLEGVNLRLDLVNPLIVDGVDMTVSPYSGHLNNKDYMDIENVAVVGSPSRVATGACGARVTAVYFETDDGFVAEILPDTWPGTSCYLDTVTFASGSNLFYSSLTQQSIVKLNDSTFTTSHRCIPFRVDR